MQNLVVHRVFYSFRHGSEPWEKASSVILTFDGAVDAGEEFKARHRYPISREIVVTGVETVAEVDAIARQKPHVPRLGECICDPAHTPSGCCCDAREKQKR